MQPQQQAPAPGQPASGSAPAAAAASSSAGGEGGEGEVFRLSLLSKKNIINDLNLKFLIQILAKFVVL